MCKNMLKFEHINRKVRSSDAFFGMKNKIIVIFLYQNCHNIVLGGR